MVEKKTRTKNGVLTYTAIGEGPPIILIHGFAASNFDWIYLEPELVAHGFKVYSPDLIGHGNSNNSNPLKGYTFEVIYQHFSDWISSMAFDQGVTLVGHSLGGLISLNFAIQNPKAIRNLVLINPYYSKKQLNWFLRYISQNPEPYRRALQATPSWMVRMIISLDIHGYIHYEDRIRRQKAEDVSRAAPEIVYIPGSIPHFSTHLQDIEAPTCLIWGTKDRTLNPSSFPELADVLPNAISVPISGTGHQPHLTKTNHVNQALIEYLEQRYEMG